VTVTVAAGSPVEIDFTEAVVSSAVKICKTSAAFKNTQFSFTVNGQPATASSSGTAGVPGECSRAFAFDPGTILTVTESVPPNEQVTNVAASNVRILSQSLTTPPTSTKNGTYTVSIKVKTGANVLTFNNEPQSPSQRGLIEVCKSSGGDPYVQALTSPLDFTVTDGSHVAKPIKVYVDQCSGPIDVAAGNVDIHEVIPDGQQVTSIVAGGSGQLGSNNLNNGDATVVVPIAAAGEATVTFTDTQQLAQLKVCKYLTSSSGALDGTQFTFTVTDPSIPSSLPGSLARPITVKVTAQAGSIGSCKIVSYGGIQVGFPIGSTATATESLAGFGKFVTSDSTSASTVIVGGQINMVSVTNQALGQIEFCKHMVTADAAYAGFVFHFTYKNTNPAVVAADPRASGTAVGTPVNCSLPILVPPGNYTVSEDLSLTTTTGPNPKSVPGFQFVSSTASGPEGNRCVPQDNKANPNCGQTFVVSVPYFSGTPGNTTEVEFTNRVPRTDIKICKQIAPGSEQPTGGMSFTFNASTTVGTTTKQFGPFTVHPPYPNGPEACTGTFGNVQLFDTSGNPSTVTVTETQGNNFEVYAIDVVPGTPVAGSPDLDAGTITFNPSAGPDVVTFTNGFPRLRCFTGQTDEPGVAGGECTILPGGGSALLSTFPCPTQFQYCYAGVYMAHEPIMGEPIGAVTNLHYSYTGGPISGGSPRFSIPIDLNGDGATDQFICAPGPTFCYLFAFADSQTCDTEHSGTVNVITDATCPISLNSGPSWPNWAAFVAANPGAKVGADLVTFIIADQPYNGTISNIAFGP